jgi:hypothetical protein
LKTKNLKGVQIVHLLCKGAGIRPAAIAERWPQWQAASM